MKRNMVPLTDLRIEPCCPSRSSDCEKYEYAYNTQIVHNMRNYKCKLTTKLKKLICKIQNPLKHAPTNANRPALQKYPSIGD